MLNRRLSDPSVNRLLKEPARSLVFQRVPRPKVPATPSSLGFVLPGASQPHRYGQ
jgi:hypothetical protein